jgi:hypothetical protein
MGTWWLVVVGIGCIAVVFKPAELAIGDAKCQCQNAGASFRERLYVKCHE